MKEIKKEDNLLDVKGTIEALIKEDAKEISQEEAIKAYDEKSDSINMKKISNNSEDESDEEDNIRKMKKELLLSLERVNILAKKIFEEKEKINLKDIKLKDKKKNNQGKSNTSKDNKTEDKSKSETEIQNDIERSRE